MSDEKVTIQVDDGPRLSTIYLDVSDLTLPLPVPVPNPALLLKRHVSLHIYHFLTSNLFFFFLLSFPEPFLSSRYVARQMWSVRGKKSTEDGLLGSRAWRGDVCALAVV